MEHHNKKFHKLIPFIISIRLKLKEKNVLSVKKCVRFLRGKYKVYRNRRRTWKERNWFTTDMVQLKCSIISERNASEPTMSQNFWSTCITFVRSLMHWKSVRCQHVVHCLRWQQMNFPLLATVANYGFSIKENVLLYKSLFRCLWVK